MIVGYSRHLTLEIAEYDAQAVARIAKNIGDNTIATYNDTLPDVNPLYSWKREEDVFVNLMTPSELKTVVSQEMAVSQGMIIGVSNAG